jgi:hypothetical protein
LPARVNGVNKAAKSAVSRMVTGSRVGCDPR